MAMSIVDCVEVQATIMGSAWAYSGERSGCEGLVSLCEFVVKLNWSITSHVAFRVS